MANVRITGLERVMQVFDIYRNEKPKQIKRQTKISGQNIAAKAKRNAPLDTGDLKRSIISVETNGGYGNEITANMDYAPFVEFGTGSQVDVPDGFADLAIQFKGKGIKKINRKAQPFLIPAFLEEVPKFKNEIEKIMQ